MATHRISMLGPMTRPVDVGVHQGPYSVEATNDVWDPLVFKFNDTATRNGLAVVFDVPQNYVGTANLIVVWTAIATTGDVEWDFDYRAVGGNDTESLDQSGTQQSVNSNDTAPSAVNERLELSVALTDANFAVGDTVTGTLFRDGTDAGDTMAETALVFGLFFEYDDA